jgi:hypothetical protein
MPAGSTYSTIATTTFGSAQTSVSFGSFSGYTDLFIVCNIAFGSTSNFQMTFNNDGGTNYSNTILVGNGSTAVADRQSNQSRIVMGYNGTTSGNRAIYNVSLMNYANTTTNKTALIRVGNPGADTIVQVGLYRSTSAITSIQFALQNGGNMNTGSTFTLYGIAAA